MTRQPDSHKRRAGWRLVCSSAGAAALLLALYAVAPAAPPARLGQATAMASQSTCVQAAATVEELIEVERGAQRAGEGRGLPVEAVIAALRACWQEYQTQMPAAGTNCALFKQLAPLVLGWSRQVSLFGLDADFAAEQATVMPWVVNGLANCYNEAFETCVDQHDPDQVFEMRAVERQLALLGADGEIDKGKYEKCLRFEVAFEAVLEHVLHATGSGLRVHVRTTVPLQGSDDGSVSGGERPLEPVALAVQLASASARAGCAISASTIEPGAPFRVLSLAADRSEPQDGMRSGAVRDYILSFERGDTRESYRVDCPSPPDTPCPNTAGLATESGGVTCEKLGAVARITSRGSHYAGYFDHLHEDERATGGYTIRGWTMSGNGGVLARKEYQRSRPFADGLVTRTENTTFELRHTPVR